MNIIKKPLDTTDIIGDMQSKIAANAGLPSNLVLPSDILTVTLLLGLPQSLAALKDIVIERDSLPTTQQLIAKVKSSMEVSKTQSNTSDMAFVFAKHHRGKPFCYNCDANGHLTKECNEPVFEIEARRSRSLILFPLMTLCTIVEERPAAGLGSFPGGEFHARVMWPNFE